MSVKNLDLPKKFEDIQEHQRVSYPVARSLAIFADYYLKQDKGDDEQWVFPDWDPQTPGMISAMLSEVALAELVTPGAVGVYIELTRRVGAGKQPFAKALRRALGQGLMDGKRFNYQNYRFRMDVKGQPWLDLFDRHPLTLFAREPYAQPLDLLEKLSQNGFDTIGAFWYGNPHDVAKKLKIKKQDIEALENIVRHIRKGVLPTQRPARKEKQTTATVMAKPATTDLMNTQLGVVLNLAGLTSMTGRIRFRGLTGSYTLNELFKKPVTWILAHTDEHFFSLNRIIYELDRLGIDTPEPWHRFIETGVVPYKRPDCCGPPAPWGDPVDLAPNERKAVVAALVTQYPEQVEDLYGVDSQKLKELMQVFCRSQNPIIFRALEMTAGSMAKGVSKQEMFRCRYDFIDPIDYDRIHKEKNYEELPLCVLLRIGQFDPRYYKMVRLYHDKTGKELLKTRPENMLRLHQMGERSLGNLAKGLAELGLDLPKRWQQWAKKG